MAESGAAAVVGNNVFVDLQNKIDEDSAIKEALRDIVQVLEKQDRNTASQLAKAHSTKTIELPSVVVNAQSNILLAVQTIQKLAAYSSQYPYYKYNYAWSHQVQTSCFLILYCAYLGGFSKEPAGQLLTIEEVGQIMQVPTNVKDRDIFHLTIEEYLHALISLCDELSRLARNSVTLGDFKRPMQISQFIKDIHAGFQILNLKNDSLRKRSDGIKYKVKEVEDVVYDLSLRGLVPKED